MIILRLLLLPMFFMFVQCMSFSGPDPVDSVASKIAKTIGKKYHFTPCALGGSVKEGKPFTVMVDFEYKGKALDFTEGRKLILKFGHDFLKEFNQQINPEDIYCYPFNFENINLAIYCRDPFGGIYKDPYVKTLVIGNNEIGFFTQDPENSLKTKQIVYEPYDEALKKIEESTP